MQALLKEQSRPPSEEQKAFDTARARLQTFTGSDKEFMSLVKNMPELPLPKWTIEVATKILKDGETYVFLMEQWETLSSDYPGLQAECHVEHRTILYDARIEYGGYKWREQVGSVPGDRDPTWKNHGPIKEGGDWIWYFDVEELHQYASPPASLQARAQHNENTNTCFATYTGEEDVVVVKSK